MSRYMKYNTRLKFAAKPASHYWPNWKKEATIGVERKAKPDFSLADASFAAIVDHYLEMHNNDPKEARNALVRYMNWSNNSKEVIEKLRKVLHYFDFVLVKAEPMAPPYLPVWKAFEELLKNHDWHYEYAEQGKSYHNKQAAESSKIKVMYQNLRKKDPEKADALYKKYAKDSKQEYSVTTRIDTQTKTDDKEYYKKMIESLEKQIYQIKMLPIGNTMSMIPSLQEKINKYKKLLAELENDEKEAELDTHQHSMESGYAHF